MPVIGFGSAARGDDQAGLLVARRLRALGVPAVEVCGDALALFEAWGDAEEVILVDAVVTGAPAGTVTTWTGRTRGRTPGDGLSTHGLGVAEVLELAEALGRLPRRVRIFGIEAGRLDPGAEPSPAVTRAVEEVAGRIAVEVRVPAGSRGGSSSPTA